MPQWREGFRWLARKLELDQLGSSGRRFFVSDERAPTVQPEPEPGRPPEVRGDDLPHTVDFRVETPTINSHVFKAVNGNGFVTVLVASWRPTPAPPDKWIELLREAPFGTQTASAKHLEWDGKRFFVERVSEAELEGFIAKIDEWVEYANRKYKRWCATEESRARHAAQVRARELQERLRR